MSPKLVQNQVATVFGRGLGFYARASAFDDLKFFSVLFKIPRKERKKRIEEVLSTVQLQDVQNQHVGEFSRGMRQRLHIARALLKDTNIILLEEPTNELDAEIAHEIQDLTRKIADNGKTILLTSHTIS